MLRQSSRKWVKQALWLSRIKLVYARITLTKFTTLYFAVALLSCLVLVSLQGVAYKDNSEAADIITTILSKSNITNGFTIFADGGLQFCQTFNNDFNPRCEPIRLGNSSFFATNGLLQPFKRDLSAVPVFDQSGTTIAVQLNETGEVLPIPCLQSLLWLRDILRDARREDVVTLLFLVWMFILSMVTILNESLPHLGASLVGHALGTAWAGFRVANSQSLEGRYDRLIVNGTCDSVDILGNWWEVRTRHTIPVIVLHLVALVALLYLSANIYKVYANQSFSRVGASPEINNIYKLVLLLSVFLQLAGFFNLAATGMWIDKILNSSVRSMAEHMGLYLGAFGLTALLQLPWMVLGWIAVRREQRIVFLVFGIVSFSLVGISSFMFSSSLYRTIFMSWPLFATMTVTSYVLLVASSALAVVCRLQFGKGLAQYLRVTEALEGMDFTPVNIPKADDSRGSSDTKHKYSPSDASMDEKFVVQSLPYVQQPKAAVLTSKGDRQVHTLSVYSDANRPTLKMSTTPPVARSVLSKSSRFSSSTTSTAITTSSAGSAPSAPPSPSLSKGSWRQEVPPVPAITRSSSRAITPLTREKSTSSNNSSTRRGIPSNPRPGSPEQVKVQKFDKPAEGYF